MNSTQEKELAEQLRSTVPGWSMMDYKAALRQTGHDVHEAAAWLRGKVKW